MAVTLFTVEGYLAHAAHPQNAGKQFELVRGVIVELPPSSPRNTVIAMRIARYIANIVEENDLG